MENIKCNFCHSDDASLVYELRDRMLRIDDKREFYLRQCRKCGLAYLSPQPQWEELEYFYGDKYYTNTSPSEIRRNFIYRFVRKIKRAVFGAPNPKFFNFGMENGVFLDIGCGSGAYESYVIKNNPGWKFYGIEPDKGSYQIANKVKDFNVFNGDLKSAQYSDNFFNVILMSHSLEHVSSPVEIVKECFRILKPGGHLIIGVPNFNSFARRLFGKYWFHLDAPRHLFHFTPDVLEKIVESTGFKTEQIRFEVLSGSISRSLAYVFNKNKFSMDIPFISLIIHYLIWPIDRLIEMTPFASGLRIIAFKE